MCLAASTLPCYSTRPPGRCLDCSESWRCALPEALCFSPNIFLADPALKREPKKEKRTCLTCLWRSAQILVLQSPAKAKMAAAIPCQTAASSLRLSLSLSLSVPLSISLLLSFSPSLPCSLRGGGRGVSNGVGGYCCDEGRR